MNNITQDLLNEYQNCQQRIGDIKEILYKKAEEVGSWENANLDNKNIIHEDSDWICEDIEINGDKIYFQIYETWAYGGYDERTIAIDAYKFIGDDWRDVALKEHLNKLEQERKKKEEAEKEAVRKKEEQERAEYERLKAKYE